MRADATQGPTQREDASPVTELAAVVSGALKGWYQGAATLTRRQLRQEHQPLASLALGDLAASVCSVGSVSSASLPSDPRTIPVRGTVP